MVKIDEIDKKLLNILQKDAKTPYSKIAKTIGISEATVHVRIKKLRKIGVIKKFQAIIDPEKVGKNILAIIAITCEPRKFEYVLEKLAEMKDIYEIYDVTGEYYALVKVRTDNRDKLAKILDNIGKVNGVLSTRTMYVLRVIKESSEIYIE